MSKTFVYADPHFSHFNIMRYAQRPWTEVAKMDSDLIKLYNTVVEKDDVVYWLGDVTLQPPDKVHWLRRILGKMNGTKHLIFGNHDDWHWQRYLDAGFQTCHTFLSLGPHAVNWGDAKRYSAVHLCHDPAWAQDKTAMWVVGHLHNCAFLAPSHIAVVSVELTEYKPVLLADIVDGYRPGSGVLRTGPRVNRTPENWNT